MNHNLIPIYHNCLMSAVTNRLQFWPKTSEGRPGQIRGRRRAGPAKKEVGSCSNHTSTLLEIRVRNA